MLIRPNVRVTLEKVQYRITVSGDRICSGEISFYRSGELIFPPMRENIWIETKGESND